MNIHDELAEAEVELQELDDLADLEYRMSAAIRVAKLRRQVERKTELTGNYADYIEWLQKRE